MKVLVQLAASQTHRYVWFVDNNLSILASELHWIHERVRLTIGGCERLRDVLDCLVVVSDLRQIQLRVARILRSDHVRELCEFLFWFHFWLAFDYTIEIISSYQFAFLAYQILKFFVYSRFSRFSKKFSLLRLIIYNFTTAIQLRNAN